MNVTRKILLPTLILLAGIGVFVWLKATRAQQPPQEIKERVWQVETEDARFQTLAPTLTLYGSVESPDLLKAAAPADAVVEQVLVREGQRVTQGQLLIQLDDRDFLPRMEQAEADVKQLEAEILSEQQTHRSDIEALKHEQQILELANAEAVRAERLKKKDLGSESALDAARQSAARQALTIVSRKSRIDDHEARLQRLDARLAQARAKLDETRLERERSRVTAPFDGVVASVSVAPGNRVRTAEVMLEMYAQDSLEVRARIPSPFRDEIQQALADGQPVLGRRDAGGSEIRLRLERLSGAAGPRGIDALFRIEHGQAWLRLGDMLTFQLQRPPRDNVLALPYQALYGGERVYVLEDGRLRGVAVEALGSLGGGNGEERVLLSAAGIREGEPVVITHLPNAITGLRAEMHGE